MVIQQNENDPRIEGKFPNLTFYKVTSFPAEYNCVAFAADDVTRIWWPSPDCYWPDGIPASESLSSFIACFESLGYDQCGLDEVFEEGYEKVAIYVDGDGIPQHVAKQFAGDNGLWRSKLASYKDIQHYLGGLSGLFPGLSYANYGNVAKILKRQAQIILPDLPNRL